MSTHEYFLPMYVPRDHAISLLFSCILNFYHNIFSEGEKYRVCFGDLNFRHMRNIGPDYDH